MDKELERIRAEKAAQLKAKMERNEPLMVTDADFDKTISENEFVIVDFWAPWCGPCRMVAPVLDQLAKKYAGLVTIVKMNVDENQQTPASFGIRGIPTMIFFKKGIQVDKVVGALSQQALESKIKEHMN